MNLPAPAGLLMSALLQGCSWESLQRTGHETLESMRVQHCLDSLDTACRQQRTSQGDHQSERQQLQGE
jgi:hypothetical protein